MDIYDYAMKMEKDGEAYYRSLATKTANAGLRAILGMLANAEVRHYELFRKMKVREETGTLDAKALDYVKNIFEILKEEQQFDLDVSQVEFYRKAQEIEIKSRDFYQEKSGEVDESRKRIFLKIADEEQRHYLILEDIINMVNRPASWLENPEWYHREDY